MSGKQSRKIRKQIKFSKKAVAGAAAVLLSAVPAASEGSEFLVSLYPKFSFPVIKFDESLSTGFGGGLRLTYRPLEVINLFVEGDYNQYSFDTKTSIGNLSVFNARAGAGYHLPLTDRLGLNFDAGVGYYTANYQRDKDSSSPKAVISGLTVGGTISVDYKIGPVVSVYAQGGLDHKLSKQPGFLTTADAVPGITINITKAFSNKTNVSVGNETLRPVFPVFYSWYNENSFGSLDVTNNEDASITDVNVYFYQPQYMSQPKDCGKTAVLKRGQTFNVDLKAFFNEQMLSLNEKSDTMASIIVEYKYLGAKRSQTFPLVVPVYGRNNMSWEDDRCASAFVSSKDPAAMWFAKYVVSAIRDNVRSGLSQNMQYAMGVFQALDEFGINYVKDPSSAFEDNVGTASIDFLQFPYQTLMYRGGDCDDLSILVCSLFESIGIKTAFITIPGHIFMAFDSGFTVEEAQNYFLTLDEFIVDNDTVWVPLEITLSDEGFNKAWHKGAWEWNTANLNGSAMMYKMEDSWKIYQPVSVPGAAAHFTLPEEKSVALAFNSTVDEFVVNQITPQIAWYENRLASAPTAANYNDFGVLYARYGLFEQAEKQFRIARNMNYLPAVLNTANLYYSKKDYDNAAVWYKNVLNRDSGNSLAMIGLARCAYEEGDYQTCDLWYGTVYKNDRTLAKQYSYLGAFEQTTGRSFSLADRLENTVWLQSADYAQRKTGGQIVAQKAEEQEEAVVQSAQPLPSSLNIEPGSSVAAVVPSGVKEEEDKGDKEEQGSSDGNGDDEYVGISSQLDFNILSAQDLAELAEETIVENGGTIEDFNGQRFTSVMTDVPLRQPVVVEAPVVEPEPAIVEMPVIEPEQPVDSAEQFVVPEPVPAVPEPVPAVPEPVEGEISKPVVQEIILETPAVTEPPVTEIVKTVTEPVPVQIEEPVVEKVEPVVKTVIEPELLAVPEPVHPFQEPVVEIPEPVSAVPEPVSAVSEPVSAVPEPVEGPELDQIPVEGPEIKKEKQRKNPIGIILAALGAAIAALFVGLKLRGKKHE